MPRTVFLRIHKAITERDEYFRERRDATGKYGASSFQKLTAALRMLAYGVSSDSLDEYCRISATSARMCMQNFCRSMCEIFAGEYLRMPTLTDLIRIQTMSAARGFPGCIGSPDCMHWEWKNCPTMYHGQYKGKEKKPTVVLEAVADSELWIWHAFFGMPGSCNDINVVDNSPLFDEIMNGRFPPSIEYVVNGVRRSRGYYLTDGIYNRWAVIVKAYQEPANEKETLFTKLQEGKRKDVERAFGFLQAKWHVLARPCKLWSGKRMADVIRCCVILHNMIIEHQRGSAVREEERATCSMVVTEDNRRGRNSEEHLPAASAGEILVDTPGTIANLTRCMGEVMCESEHLKLRHDLVEHIWDKFGKEK